MRYVFRLLLASPGLSIVAASCAVPTEERNGPLADAETQASVTGLDELPRGEGQPSWVWVDDGVLQLGHREIRVGDGAVPVNDFRAVFVWTPEGTIVAVNRRSGEVTSVTEDAAGPPVAHNNDVVWASLKPVGSDDAAVTYARYEEQRYGRTLERPEVVLVDEQTLPVPCCDGRFQLRGITQFATLLVDSSAGPWARGTSEGQEGVAHGVPGLDDNITTLADDAQVSVAQPSTRIVLRKVGTYTFVDDPYGNILPGPTGPVRLGEAVLDPGLRWAAVVTADGVTVRSLEGGKVTALALPEDAGVGAAAWSWSEGSGYRVNVDLTDTQGRRGIVSCDRFGPSVLEQLLPVTAIVAW